MWCLQVTLKCRKRGVNKCCKKLTIREASSYKIYTFLSTFFVGLNFFKIKAVGNICPVARPWSSPSRLPWRASILPLELFTCSPTGPGFSPAAAVLAHGAAKASQDLSQNLPFLCLKLSLIPEIKSTFHTKILKAFYGLALPACFPYLSRPAHSLFSSLRSSAHMFPLLNTLSSDFYIFIFLIIHTFAHTFVPSKSPVCPLLLNSFPIPTQTPSLTQLNFLLGAYLSSLSLAGMKQAPKAETFSIQRCVLCTENKA